MLQPTANPLTAEPTTRATLRTRSAARRRFKRAARQQNAASQIGELPGDGEDVVMILTGDYHGWDIVGAVIELAGVAVSHLRVATLGFNRSQTTHLAELIDAGKVQRFTMVVSEMFRDKNKSEFAFLRETLESRGQMVSCGRNHAKLMCFEMDDGRRVVSHGSLNLRRCNSFEQIAISADPDLHDFFAGFINEQAG